MLCMYGYVHYSKCTHGISVDQSRIPHISQYCILMCFTVPCSPDLAEHPSSRQVGHDVDTRRSV